MNADQWAIIGILAGALVLFVWGRWRYDVVAMMALIAAVLLGVVPAGQAFSGFAETAVVTVAAVLVISRALQNSGLVNLLVRRLTRVGNSWPLQVLATSGTVAVLSSFMNNVGALAIMLPVAVTLAQKSGRSAGSLLMPLAFASLLGGMTTLIGTPPNLIISQQREALLGQGYGMFAFAPVGVAVALVGLAYLVVLGWRLLPKQQQGSARGDLYRMADYMTEARVPVGSPLAGRKVKDVGALVAGVQVVALIRGRAQRPFPQPTTNLEEGDILIVEANTEQLSELLESGQLVAVGGEKVTPEQLASDEIAVSELVVTALSPVVGQSAAALRLRQRMNINLIAVSRQGRRLRERLSELRFAAGDVMLVQGPPANIAEAVQTLGCLPLASRPLELGIKGQRRRMWLTVGIFAAAIALATAGVLPIAISFVSAALLMVLLRLITLRDVYSSVEWPVLILLGALIPVGVALETTGTAALLAQSLLGVAADWPPIVLLVLLMVITMTLSDIVNNAATALLMAPIAVGLAQGLGVSADPFLLGVAIAASCAFLTPIGHQSNTLVMGPGGYKFSDYWRVGLPLEVLVLAVSAPLLAYVIGF